MADDGGRYDWARKPLVDFCILLTSKKWKQQQWESLKLFNLTDNLVYCGLFKHNLNRSFDLEAVLDAIKCDKITLKYSEIICNIIMLMMSKLLHTVH